MEIKGNYFTQRLAGHERKFASVCYTYEFLNQIGQAKPFNAYHGKGNQREYKDSHASFISKKMIGGEYTPTSLCLSFDDEQLTRLKIDEKEKTFEYNGPDDDKLLLSDGQHRMGAIKLVLDHLRAALKVAQERENPSQEAISALNLQIKETLECELPVTILLDGNNMKDFAALQAGRNADKTHLFAMATHLDAKPEARFAFNLARLLNKEGEPLGGRIRIDGRGKNPLPASSLCGSSASELATSFIGTAKICARFKQKEPFAARMFKEVMNSFEDFAPELIEYGENGKVLTTSVNNGSIGATTMMIGVLNCFIYKLLVEGKSVTPDERQYLAEVAQLCLDVDARNNLSAASKRSLIGNFARNYFLRLDIEKHDQIPLELVELLSVSTFDAVKLTKRKK